MSRWTAALFLSSTSLLACGTASEEAAAENPDHIADVETTSGSEQSHDLPAASAQTQQLEAACHAGDEAACSAFANLLFRGGATQSRSPEQLQIDCNAGDGAACYDLSYLYLRGNGVERSTSRYLELMEIACRRQMLDACRQLANQYSQTASEDVPWDRPRAVSLYSYACDQGHAESCSELALLFEISSLSSPAEIAQIPRLRQRACLLGATEECEPPAVP